MQMTPPPLSAVLPERLVHSVNQCNISGNRTCNRSMRGNHLAYAATQGGKLELKKYVLRQDNSIKNLRRV